MRVLRVHAPGTDAALAAHVEAAMRAFNAGLDFRLRFLAIGIEERVLVLEEGADAAERMREALGEGGVAEAVVILGSGAAAVAAAGAAAAAGVPIVRVGSGRRTDRGGDDDRAVDRLADVRLAHDEQALRVLQGEGMGESAETVGAPDDPASGERIVRALSRARRRRPC